MPRAVVARPSPRCPACRLPLRWCICTAYRPVALPLGVDVLMHYCEQHRPSSTGHLVKRLVPATRLFLGGGGRPADRAAIAQPGRELWILHPQGEPPPVDATPERTQVLLIDGSWKQASDLLRPLCGWGRIVRLPMAGESRFQLRAQQGEHQFSTIEALLFLLARFGLAEAHEAIRLQFELHVFAGLLARGKRAEARAYVACSPVQKAFPELVARLDPHRDA
jgi:DTW domain-containing protein YfiP